MTDKKTILIDTHAHLDDERYDKDRDEVIKRAKDTSAAAVLVFSFYSLIIALVIFFKLFFSP